MQDTLTLPVDSVYISDKSLKSKDTYDIINSNISFVNALFSEYLEQDELCPQALISYYTDYYLAQLENGGCSQFVYNSRWDKVMIDLVKTGLSVMRAEKHLALFLKLEALVEEMKGGQLERFFSSEYFGDNEERDNFGPLDDELDTIYEEEDLVSLNAAWLKSLPNLKVLSIKEMEKAVDAYGKLVPDREARIAKSLENEPEYAKTIRYLCSQTGMELDRITAGDPSHTYNGVETLAWHFLTDQGHYYFIELDDTVRLFDDDDHEVFFELRK